MYCKTRDVLKFQNDDDDPLRLLHVRLGPRW